MARSPRKRRAWVVRWESTDPELDQKVAAVLPSRWDTKRVMGAVELLYAAREYSPADMLEASRSGGHNPYPAHLSHKATIDFGSITQSAPTDYEVSCGHNPFLLARRASVWQCAVDPLAIEWLDDPPPRLPGQI